MSDNSWKFDANCIDQWFLFDSQEDSDTGRSYYPYEPQAKAICAGCPVRDKCLSEAVANKEPQGIFGGVVFPIKKRKAVV